MCYNTYYACISVLIVRTQARSRSNIFRSSFAFTSLRIHCFVVKLIKCSVVFLSYINTHLHLYLSYSHVLFSYFAHCLSASIHFAPDSRIKTSVSAVCIRHTNEFFALGKQRPQTHANIIVNCFSSTEFRTIHNCM